ncbi:hypothetical protein BDV19DRAFT_366148 [Aspergillus venezuelensis]
MLIGFAAHAANTKQWHSFSLAATYTHVRRVLPRCLRQRLRLPLSCSRRRLLSTQMMAHVIEHEEIAILEPHLRQDASYTLTFIRGASLQGTIMPPAQIERLLRVMVILEQHERLVEKKDRYTAPFGYILRLLFKIMTRYCYILLLGVYCEGTWVS